MNLRAQTWSALAYSKVCAAKEASTSAKYRTSCMKMPGLIHQSGLLQALVFQVAKEDAGRAYINDLASTYFADPKADYKRLIQEAQGNNKGFTLIQYMTLTRDIVEIAQWFRRFAQIELPNKSDD